MYYIYKNSGTLWGCTIFINITIILHMHQLVDTNQKYIYNIVDNKRFKNSNKGENG